MRAQQGVIPYNADVTPTELWRSVGEILAGHRIRREWNHSDVERHGGPTYKTVQQIERGKIGTVTNLARHCEAMGLSVVDVLRAALDRTAQPLSPEAVQVVRKFERTTVEGRQALLFLARALPEAKPEPSTPHPPPDVLPGKGPRNTR